MMFRKFLPLLLTLAVLTACTGPVVPNDPSLQTQPTAPSDPTATVKPTDPTQPSTVPPTDPKPTQTEPAPTQTNPKPTEPPQTRTMRVVTDTYGYDAPDGDAKAAFLLGELVEVLESGESWSSILTSEGELVVPTAHLRDPEHYLIVLDAGHQARGNYDREPVGPGAEETKAKVTSGTEGVSTGLDEYKLNLMVALKLQTILQERGYDVVMVRTTHDVDISNAERAAVANGCYADAFIRIHANGSSDPKVNGMITICQTPDNPYNARLYAVCRALSDAVLQEMAATTGAKPLYVWETDTMSGINWCSVPVTIVEMGFMSNPEEDEKMATDAYQDQLALGIANGLDVFFGRD